jgi:hypothetical protein
VLIRFGVVPEEVCEKCNNVWLHSAAPQVRGAS